MVDLVTIKRSPAIAPTTPYLVPATALDLQRLEKFRDGDAVATELTFARSLPHQKWYRKFVSVVADGLGRWPDGLHADLKFKAGLVLRIMLTQAAGVCVILKSTAFRAMGQEEFQAYVSVAVEIVFRDYLPGVRRRAVFDKVNEMVDPLWNIRMDDMLYLDEMPRNLIPA